MNSWLTPVVEAYVDNFGMTERPVVWDVGSRDGRDGVELAQRIYPGGVDAALDAGLVVCVEANPAQAEVIREQWPEVWVFEVAASNEDGLADFIVYKGDEGAVGSSSLLLDWKEDDLEGDVITVRTVRLESLLPDGPVDIMKIDVEGCSLAVLRGLGKRLSQIRVLHVETEDWTGSDKAVKAYLEERGWRLTDERQEWSGMPDLTWVNTAFI